MNAVICHAQTFTGPEPLHDLALRLEARYGKPVTLEWPLVVWMGELRLAWNNAGLLTSDHSLVLKETDGIFSAPAISVGLIQKSVDEYQRQNPGRSRYKVLESKIGFHIVPSEVHDEAGILRPAKSVLDSPAYLRSAPRTFTEHVMALIDAVSLATGVRFTPFLASHRQDDLEWEYLSTMPRPMSRPVSRPGIEVQAAPPFEWGAYGVSAREALIDLLSKSATSMTWDLRCGPQDGSVKQQGCNLLLSATPGPAGR